MKQMSFSDSDLTSGSADVLRVGQSRRLGLRGNIFLCHLRVGYGWRKACSADKSLSTLESCQEQFHTRPIVSWNVPASRLIVSSDHYLCCFVKVWTRVRLESQILQNQRTANSTWTWKVLLLTTRCSKSLKSVPPATYY